MRIARVAAVSLVVCAVCGPVRGQLPPQEVATNVPPADLTAEPPAFRSGATVTFSAALVSPEPCPGAGLALRLYRVDASTGEPSFDTSYLAQVGSDYDFGSAAGTKVEARFHPIEVPADSGPDLYAVVWNTCTVRFPKSIDESGHIIWDEETVGLHLGSATFHLICEAGGKHTSVCTYRKT